MPGRGGELFSERGRNVNLFGHALVPSLTFFATLSRIRHEINKKLVNSFVKEVIALEKLGFKAQLALNSTGSFGECRSLFFDCFTCDKICCGSRPEWEPLCVAPAPENPSSSHKLDQNVSGISFGKGMEGEGG